MNNYWAWQPLVLKLGLHLLLLVAVGLALFPLAYMLGTALSPIGEIRSGSGWWPQHPTLDNFGRAFQLQPVVSWLFTTISYSLLITAGRLLLSVPAAYAFSWLRFRGRGWLFSLVLGTMVVPYMTTVVPNFILVAGLGWRNTLQAVVVPQLAWCAFGVFLLRQQMLTLPLELFESARLDGAGHGRILWWLVLPLTRGPLVAVAIIYFLDAWNLYIWPSMVLLDDKVSALTVGMSRFVTTDSTGFVDWGALMATATVALLPPLLLYVLAQRWIINNLVTSGFK